MSDASPEKSLLQVGRRGMWHPFRDGGCCADMFRLLNLIARCKVANHDFHHSKTCVVIKQSPRQQVV